MAMEQWIAAASMGLFVLFAGEMVSIYQYMQQAPEDLDAGIIFEPDPKILQFISIGVAPAAIMAAVSFLLSKRYGSRRVGSLIIIGGVGMIIGMAYCYSITIHEVYMTTATTLSPPLFIIAGIPVVAFGTILFRLKPRRRRKDYL